MNSLWGNIFKVRQKDEDAMRDILRRVPIFEDLGGGTSTGLNAYFTVASMGKTRSSFFRDSLVWGCT